MRILLITLFFLATRAVAEIRIESLEVVWSETQLTHNCTFKVSGLEIGKSYALQGTQGRLEDGFVINVQLVTATNTTSFLFVQSLADHAFFRIKKL